MESEVIARLVRIDWNKPTVPVQPKKDRYATKSTQNHLFDHSTTRACVDFCKCRPIGDIYSGKDPGPATGIPRARLQFEDTGGGGCKNISSRWGGGGGGIIWGPG